RQRRRTPFRPPPSRWTAWDPVSRHAPQRRDLAFAIFDDGGDMLSPARERRDFLRLVGCAIVDASNAALVARDVIEDSLDDVRLHTDLGCPGGKRSAQIVNCPRRNPESFIEPFPTSGPAGKAA